VADTIISSMTNEQCWVVIY